jgi:hypothetical protein
MEGMLPYPEAAAGPLRKGGGFDRLKNFSPCNSAFPLGPLVIDMDLEILGCTCRMHSIFNYIKRNIHNLDQFLGNKWDILEMEEEFYKFVSQISFKIDKAGIGKVSIATSRGEGVLQGDYRGTIQERINLYGM